MLITISIIVLAVLFRFASPLLFQNRSELPEPEAFKKLSSQGKDAWDEVLDKQSPLDAVNTLIQSGKDLNKADRDGITPLYRAAVFDQSVDAVRALVKAGANVNHEDENGLTVLDTATCYEPNEAIIQALIQAGADVQHQDPHGGTPLHFADSMEVVKVLIAAGASIHQTDNVGATPLHWAAQYRLFDYHFDVLPDEPDQNSGLEPVEETPKPPAPGALKVEVIKALFDAGSNINQADNNGATPLHWAFTSLLDMKDLNESIERGVPLNRVDTFLAQNAIVAALIQAGANPNSVNAKGETPLHLATSHCLANSEAIELLIQAGADIHPVDHEGRTPFSCAMANDHPELVDCLKRLGATH